MFIYMWILIFLFCTSLVIYTTAFAGWSSNSNYSLLGSLHSVAQTISYEVSLVLILLSPIVMVSSYDLYYMYLYQYNSWFCLYMFPLFLAGLTSWLAETIRTPFDFSEGSSELVSGFNIEYGANGFTLLFLAEYTSILFMSMMLTLMFLSGDYYSLMFLKKLALFSFLFMLILGTLPQLRYNKLMYLAWMSFLPLPLNYLCFLLDLSY